MNAIYETSVTSTGGRTGRSVAEDGRLDVQLDTPQALGGNDGPGTNPEQLFAAGYSACFIGALKFVAQQEKLALPEDVSVTATIGIGQNTKGEGFAISADLVVDIPGFEESIIEELVETAHKVCPYSNATRGNIDITTRIRSAE